MSTFQSRRGVRTHACRVGAPADARSVDQRQEHVSRKSRHGTHECVRHADPQTPAAQVFPPAVVSKIEVHRDYDEKFPPLLMHRRHLSEAVLNLLQNAREALNERGHIHVHAHCGDNNTLQIAIEDDGPGIAFDKLDKIFEAYVTTKEKGTAVEVRTIVRYVLIALTILFALLELAAFIMAVRLNRTITRAVGELYRATIAIDSGNFAHRIQVQRRDQLGALSTSFNTMSESLERLLVQQRHQLGTIRSTSHLPQRFQEG